MSILQGFAEKSGFLRGVMKNQYVGGDCLKRGSLDSLHIQGEGGLAKEEGRGVDTPMHTMNFQTLSGH